MSCVLLSLVVLLGWCSRAGSAISDVVESVAESEALLCARVVAERLAFLLDITDDTKAQQVRL